MIERKIFHYKKKGKLVIKEIHDRKKKIIHYKKKKGNS
jgi:hypothetical protein